MTSSLPDSPHSSPVPAHDPSRLAPEHAFYGNAPPIRQRHDHLNGVALGGDGSESHANDNASLNPSSHRRRSRDARSKSRGRRRDGQAPGQWKKLLWIKQPYPDNYTDPPTFLSHLQRNPRLQPYDFWPLVADSTVIVQHVCAVAIFVACFVGIYQERLGPVNVVSIATAITCVAWVVWDLWLTSEDYDNKGSRGKTSSGTQSRTSHEMAASPALSSRTASKSASSEEGVDLSVPVLVPRSSPRPRPSSSRSDSVVPTRSSQSALLASNPLPPLPSLPRGPQTQTPSVPVPPSITGYEPEVSLWPAPLSSLSPHFQKRLMTAKSAILIYVALLGLSPILKSLTKSTSEDSIWAMSCWLMIINVFFFNYGSNTPDGSTNAGAAIVTATAEADANKASDQNNEGKPEALPLQRGAVAKADRFPASLSTNAALMASTVLASRLPSTTHVFSLTLFSIEVFGLFPIFRRSLRARSALGHYILTVILIVISGAALGMMLLAGGQATNSEEEIGAPAQETELVGAWPLYRAAGIGIVVWGLASLVGMGGCSWWLIGLQRYKNVVIGPWDPARPVIRQANWD